MKKTRYAIAADYQRLPSLNLSFSRWSVMLLNLLMVIARLFHRNKSGVDTRRQRIPRNDGSTLRILVMKPPGLVGTLPCLVYFHGGAFALTYGATHITMAQRYARDAGCCVIFVDYRLMPSHPFPAGLDDCYTALQWTLNQAQTLGIDSKRIAVGGDSAGGALSAAVCQMSQDRDTATICAQMLIYPALDKDCKTRSAREFTDTPIWTSASNRAMWQVYLRNCPPERIPPYASPAHRQDLSGLPPAYVETAEFDPLHDEGVDYARRLTAAGVEVQLNETQGTVHGFDAITSSVAGSKAVSSRIEFLRKHFAPV